MIPQNMMTSLNPTLTMEEQLTDMIISRDTPELNLLEYY